MKLLFVLESFSRFCFWLYYTTGVLVEDSSVILPFVSFPKWLFASISSDLVFKNTIWFSRITKCSLGLQMWVCWHNDCSFSWGSSSPPTWPLAVELCGPLAQGLPVDVTNLFSWGTDNKVYLCQQTGDGIGSITRVSEKYILFLPILLCLSLLHLLHFSKFRSQHYQLDGSEIKLLHNF